MKWGDAGWGSDGCGVQVQLSAAMEQQHSINTNVCQRHVTESVTHRLLSSSFLDLPCRILDMNQKQELLSSLWVWAVLHPL